MKKALKILALATLATDVWACSVFRSGGEAVESVGRGTGRALYGTGEAIGDAGSAIGQGAGDIVEGTGSAIKRGANRVEQKGY